MKRNSKDKGLEDVLKHFASYYDKKASGYLTEARLSLIGIGIVAFLIIMYAMSQI